MEIVISEGKFDVWFLDELIRPLHNGNIFSITIPLSRAKEFQKLIWKNSGYQKAKDMMLIVGNDGKPGVYNQIMRRIVITCLGSVEGITNINLIIDDDGTSHDALENTIHRILKEIASSRRLYPSPELTKSQDIFEIFYNKSRGIVKMKLHTIQRSLEYQIVKKITEIKCPKKKKLLRIPSHDALDFLAVEYYSGDKESLIREAARELSGERWVQQILSPYLNT